MVRGDATALPFGDAVFDVAVAVNVLDHLADPVPLYPWTRVHHRQLRHPALDALRAGADQLARRERWLKLPPDHWIPESDTAAFGFA